MGKPGDATGLPYAKDGVFVLSRTAIDTGRGIAARNKLFNMEAIAPGATFDIGLRLETRDDIDALEEELVDILSVFGVPHGRSIGGDVASGFGRVRIADDLFATEEYALLQVALPEVEGTGWEPYTRYAYSYLSLADDDPRSTLSDEELGAKHPEVSILYDGRREVADPGSEWFLLLGKGAGRVKCTSPNAADDCEAFRQRFEQMKVDSNRWLQE